MTEFEKAVEKRLDQILETVKKDVRNEQFMKVTYFGEIRCPRCGTKFSKILPYEIFKDGDRAEIDCEACNRIYIVERYGVLHYGLGTLSG